MKFPWVQVTILLAVSTIGLVMADSNLHGSFKDSSVGQFLSDTGVSEKFDEVSKQIDTAIAKAADSEVLETIKDSASIAHEELMSGIQDLLVKLQEYGGAEKLNSFLKLINEYLIMAAAKIQELSYSAADSLK